ncbi:hypothetical protein FRC08_017069 [Ceratobasidium sp. 394]|nr:hypothetical protein FRC08_017069 [Ceratobasidium sp. 394]
MAPGEAADWAQPLLQKVSEKDTQGPLKSWSGLKVAFLLHFQDPVKKEKAIRELTKLTQTKSAQAYTTQFRILIQEVEWNQGALIDKFKEGLKLEVQKELLRLTLFRDTNNATLNDWVALTCRTNDMVFASQKTTPKTIVALPTHNWDPCDKTLKRREPW